MAKKYNLVGATTYCTLTAVFRAGIDYSEKEVEKVVDDTNAAGDSLFAEKEVAEEAVSTGEVKDPSQKKGVLIVGGKKRAGDAGAGDGNTGGDGGQQAGAQNGGETITV